MNIEINSQQAEWLREELEIMIEEHLSMKCRRSQFGINTMRSLLAKINEAED
jgi:uncharacterized protein YneR